MPDAGKKLTKAEDDLRANWVAFCYADPFDGKEDFTERMERAGLIELISVTEDDLESPFASERGIEEGGHVWHLTKAGRLALQESGKK